MRAHSKALLGLALGLGALLSGCSVGAYPVDVFPEMHYQPSYRSQEPPRLQPPADSVPVAGREVDYTFAGAGELQNPVPGTAENLARAAQLYRVNCAVCHGPGGGGDGPMARRFQEAGAPPPVDLAGARVSSRRDGELFWIIGNGLGNMPPFRRLLAPEERWLLIRFIRSLSGG